MAHKETLGSCFNLKHSNLQQNHIIHHRNLTKGLVKKTKHKMKVRKENNLPTQQDLKGIQEFRLIN